MNFEILTPLANILTAVTGMCTFLLALFIAFQASRIHKKTDELVVHTNSLTDKLMEKTDTLARAEGIKEGASLASGIPLGETSALAKETAEAAALIIKAAASQAAEVLAKAVTDSAILAAQVAADRRAGGGGEMRP